MMLLSKVHLLAVRHGWSMDRAQGFVDGEISRRRGTPPSTYARVGIDDYCLGYRAGYYERGEPRERDRKVMSASVAADTREAAVQENAFKRRHGNA